MSYNVGDRIGDYQIVDVLGAGGMGKVYKVRNAISDRVEAMKVLLPNLESDPELADRFMREIKVQASLDHPNIAGLHTALRINNQLIMLLEFVEGRTIEQELRNARIPVAKGVDYIKQALSALSYAHSRGVVHRDIKPANIMLTPDGTVKLMDFGIARMTADRKLTQTGRTVGSLYYMSPEQINGALDLDGRSDLYSIGISLYEIVTNRRPFQGDSDYSIMAAHLNTMPVPPIEVDPTLPAALNEIILMSITKDPAQRFQTAEAFRAALESIRPGFAPASQIVTAPISSSAPPLPQSPTPPPPPSSRRGLYMAVGSVVTIGVLAVAATQAPKFFGPSSAASSVQSQPVTPEPAPVSRPEASAQIIPATPEPQQPAESKPIASQPKQIAQVRPEVVRPQPAQQSPVQSPRPVTPAPQQQPTVQAAPPPAQQQKAVTVNTQELDDLQERMLLLATRANSVRGSLESMRRQMGALNLNSDFTGGEQRMEAFLDQAESALKASDAARAKKSLDSAERAIEFLEKKFGR